VLLLPGVLYYNNLYVVTACICTADISAECWRTLEYRILKESTGKQKKYFFSVHVTVHHVTVHHVTVHRNKFLYTKTNQMHRFPKFTPARTSTCFGQFLCPSSEVYSLYTRHWYVIQVCGKRPSRTILVLLGSCPQTCMTYQCRVYSE
jgi:hypothetical protein